MKKTMLYLLTILLIISMISGCTPTTDSNGEYTTAIIGYCDSMNMGGLSVEYEVRDYEGFKNKKGKANVSFTLGDMKIEGTCKDTSGKFVRSNYYPVYVYGEFWLNPNGKLECYNWKKSDSASSQSKEKCSEEEIIEIAKNFASKIVNVNDYSISIENWENCDCWTVFFYKYVDGIKTTEQFYVSVSYYGELENYVADMLDQFPLNTKNPFDMEKVEETVQERLEERLKDIENYYDRVEYNEEYRLTRLKDGSLAIHCTVDIEGIKAISEYEDEHGGELIEMLIMQ